MESKTPRTDAEFARQLEKELAEAGKKVFAYKTALELSEKELAEARAEIESCKKVAIALNDEIRLQRSYVVGRDATIERKDKLIEQMQHFIENLAGQKTTDEMTDDAFGAADFEGGYDYIVTDARRIKAALAAEHRKAALSAAEKGECL